MTTLNKIVYDIAHSQGREHELDYIERLKFRVHGLRATIIRRDLDRNRFTPNIYLQTIGCLDMEFVDASSCCGVEVGCKVYRSTDRVPEPVRFKDRIPFYYVGTIDSKIEYAPINRAALGTVGYSKFTAGMPRYYFDDGYIYVLGTLPKAVQVKGVFEYPNQLAPFSCDGKACYDDDQPYPISADLARDITRTLLGEDVRTEQPDKDKDEVTIDG
ncbi:hypothetical protein PP178_03980 [Zeaxanthinibacter sp. PT1]|uniref:hypothetical protein n=1 Tax=Zeaxanthinibacter TaxID=561554 RepID=UPI00234BD8B7|nr:hypothetical protein [Zeaxanthinibacter sp. PT1]MDC6350699.1 hypothetical protein [Zeaxanthinibacter sp. PT1]